MAMMLARRLGRRLIGFRPRAMGAMLALGGRARAGDGGQRAAEETAQRPAARGRVTEGAGEAIKRLGVHAHRS
jgi:hypothetical protein